MWDHPPQHTGLLADAFHRNAGLSWKHNLLFSLTCLIILFIYVSHVVTGKEKAWGQEQQCSYP